MVIEFTSQKSAFKLDAETIFAKIQNKLSPSEQAVEADNSYKSGNWSDASKQYMQIQSRTNNPKLKEELQNKINVINQDQALLNNAIKKPSSDASKEYSQKIAQNSLIDNDNSKSAYVAQHETAFLSKDNSQGLTGLRTENVGQCIAVATYNKEQGISLTHVDTQTSQQSLTKMFKDLPPGSHEIHLFGGRPAAEGNNLSDKTKLQQTVDNRHNDPQAYSDMMHKATKFNATKTLAAMEEANKSRPKNEQLTLKSADIGDNRCSSAGSINLDGTIRYDRDGYSSNLNKAAERRDFATTIMSDNHPIIRHDLDSTTAKITANQDMRSEIRQTDRNTKASSDITQEEKLRNSQSVNKPKNASEETKKYYDDKADKYAEHNQHFINTEKAAQQEFKTSNKEMRDGSRMGSNKASKIQSITNKANIEIGDNANTANKDTAQKIFSGTSYEKSTKEMRTQPKNWRNLLNSKISGKSHISTDTQKLKTNIAKHNAAEQVLNSIKNNTQVTHRSNSNVTPANSQHNQSKTSGHSR